MSVDLKEVVGKNLARNMALNGITGVALAKETGLSAWEISRLKGGNMNVKLSTLELLANALDVSPADLLRE